jgi:hypothetical protein
MQTYFRSLLFVFLLGFSQLLMGQVAVPIGGNSWVKNGQSEQIKAGGLESWSGVPTVLDTYVRFGVTGKLKIYLVAKVVGKSTAKVTFAGHSKEFTMEESHKEPHYIGEWEVSKAGYYKIELQGISRTDVVFAKPAEWRLEGSVVNDHMAFVKDNEGNYFYWGRRGPSVHLNYPIPVEEDIEWFYNEVTVPEGEDVVGSYFMANGFGEGYFGMQVNSDKERRILFSVWSPFKTNDPKSIPKDKQITMMKKGEGVYTGEFGNEGSGGQSYLKFNWQAGNTYRFLLSGKPSGDSSTTYTAYFFAPEIGKWSLIASFKRPDTHTYLKKLHSFLENFIPEKGDKGRLVYFGNQWVGNTSGKWKELTQAKFSADATARKGYRMDYAGGQKGNRFFLQNCGFFDLNTIIGTEFNREPKGEAPKLDLNNLP